MVDNNINIVDREGPNNPCEGGGIKEQDRLLPIANVGRIMKHILPQNAKISKEVKETMQECVSEFISFVTGEASDKCHKEKRKTVNGDDICWALGNLGFDDYVEPLKRYLHRYRESEGEKANQNKAAAGNNSIYEEREKDEIPNFKGESQRNLPTSFRNLQGSFYRA
ncbi:unnamed protein product [Withania somnifera]